MADKKWDFSDLKALFIYTTLKKSPKKATLKGSRKLARLLCANTVLMLKKFGQ